MTAKNRAMETDVPQPRECQACGTVPEPCCPPPGGLWSLRCGCRLVERESLHGAIATWNAAPWHEEKEEAQPVECGRCEEPAEIKRCGSGHWSCGCYGCGRGATSRATRLDAVRAWNADDWDEDGWDEPKQTQPAPSPRPHIPSDVINCRCVLAPIDEPSPFPRIPEEALRIPAVGDAFSFVYKVAPRTNRTEACGLTIELLRAQGFPIDALCEELSAGVNHIYLEGHQQESEVADILAKYDTTEPAKEKPPEPDCAPPSLPRRWGMIGGQWR